MAESEARPGVSYTRWSDPKQGQGDSEARQAEAFRGFCQRHNLTPWAEAYLDKGLSGYKDHHRTKGKLGVLIGHAQENRFPLRAVIVVEAWDRLGRLRPDRQIDLIRELLETGVSIGVCRLDDIFTEEDFGTHKWTTLAVFVQLAYQESKQKAERVAASRVRGRERARAGGLLTRKLPLWLRVNDQGQAEFVPGRREVIQKIFRLAADGMGYTRIVRALEREKVPPFTRKWTRVYVYEILTDGRARGVLQPKFLNGKPAGEPVKIPAAVTEEEWALAHAAQDARLQVDSKGRKVSGRRERKFVYTFQGLLVHARDGEGFLLHNRGSSRKSPLVLLNAAGKAGRAPCVTLPFLAFEHALLGQLAEVDPKDVLPKKVDTGPTKLQSLRAELALARKDVEEIKASLKRKYSSHLDEVLRDHESRVQRLEAEESAETARQAGGGPQAAWEKVPSLVDQVEKEGDAARLRLRVVLRQILEEIRVLPVRVGLTAVILTQAYFSGGGRRTWWVCHRAASRHRQTETEVHSFFVTAADAAEIYRFMDLRDPTHVEYFATFYKRVLDGSFEAWDKGSG
jgi:DNA invertase Pin-like site-specific DNA recombinase